MSLRIEFPKAAVLFALVALVLAGMPQGIVLAQEEKKEEGKREAPDIDPTTGKRLSEAIEFLNAEKYAEAKGILGKLSLDRLSPYERSRVEQIYAFLAHSENDLGAAQKHLEAAIASGGLNDQELSQARYQIAQIFISQERWQEGVNALKKWFETAQSPNSAAYHLLAVASYQLKDYKGALQAIQKAIELSGKPQESWLQLLLAIHLQSEDYQQAIAVLKRLVATAPDKKTYWIQLSAVNGQLEKYEDAVVVMQVAYTAGLLTDDSEFRRLSELLAYVGIPYRAALLLSQSIDSKKVKSDGKIQEKLASLWIAAREFEKAVKPLGQAAEVQGNGELFVRLAEVQIQRENWSGATEALRRGLEKGNLKDLGNTQVLMGISLYSQKKLQEARSWFQQASGQVKVRKQAEGWIQHIDSQLAAH